MCKRLIQVFTVCCLITAGLTSCTKKPTNPEVIIMPSAEPVPRSVGQAIGDPETFVVDATGGTFTSADNTLRIEVPAGAVTIATTIKIQPVRNTCPGSVGTSYSITPHGITFAKSVTLQYSYADNTDNVNIPEALGLAYQDDKGIWELVKGAVVDKNNKTVRIQTTHFSNWSLLQWLKLQPASATVPVDQSIPLQVTSFVSLEPDDILAPLITPGQFETGIGLGFTVPAGFIKGWQLGGVGKLVANGSNATYDAPATVAAPTTVAVSAQIASTKHQLLVVSNITVVPDGITLRINGGAWKTFPGTATSFLGDAFGISSGAADNPLSISIVWQGGIGSYRWNRDVPNGAGTVMALNDVSDHTTYDSFYKDAAGNTKQSVGTLRINELGNANQYIDGAFFASPAGHTNYMTGVQLGTVTVQGYFHVKRIF